MKTKISVIIPAFNEENAVLKVINDIPNDWVDEVIVVNNNSTDNTTKQAIKGGATVLDESRKGYGFACLKGISYLESKKEKPDIIVFMDADYSDYPEELPMLVKPILEQRMDLVIGSRAIGNRERGSMTVQQQFGNWLATRIMKCFYKVNYTDLGPFRAIKYDKLLALEMEDKTYGWTVEMQIKAAKAGYKTCEVPVSYKKRIGFSKVSGTLKGTVMAGFKILYLVFKYR